MRRFERRYSGCGEETNVTLPGIETRFPGRPVVTIVTGYSILSCVCLTVRTFPARIFNLEGANRRIV